MRAQCSHASVGLAQARPNDYVVYHRVLAITQMRSHIFTHLRLVKIRLHICLIPSLPSHLINNIFSICRLLTQSLTLQVQGAIFLLTEAGEKPGNEEARWFYFELTFCLIRY